MEFFEPYLIKLDEIDPDLRFLICNERAKVWYDKPQAAWVRELQWTVDNVKLEGRTVIDAGCHYGLYSLVYAHAGADVIAIDVHRPNLDMLHVNTVINNLPVRYLHGAVAHEDGFTYYNGKNLGTITSEQITRVPCFRLPTICKEAHVVKLDIEGAEYTVVPDAIDEMPNCDTWIVEIHPFEFKEQKTEEMITNLINLFLDRDYELHWIDRELDEESQVVPYPNVATWKIQSTIFAQR